MIRSFRVLNRISAHDFIFVTLTDTIHVFDATIQYCFLCHECNSVHRTNKASLSKHVPAGYFRRKMISFRLNDFYLLLITARLTRREMRAGDKYSNSIFVLNGLFLVTAEQRSEEKYDKTNRSDRREEQITFNYLRESSLSFCHFLCAGDF